MRMGMNELLFETRGRAEVTYDHYIDQVSILARKRSCEPLSLLLLALRFN